MRPSQRADSPTHAMRLAQCAPRNYSQTITVSFRHKGLEKFFKTGSTAGIQASHKKKLQMRLALLHNRWAISVSCNRRLTFESDGDKFSILDYEDYH